MALSTVVLATCLIAALMNISLVVGDKMARELKSYGANITITPKGEDITIEIGDLNYSPLKGRVYIAEADLPKIKEIFWHNNIVGYAPFLRTGVEMEGRQRENIELVGTNFDKGVLLAGGEDFRIGVKSLNPSWEVQGTWPADDDVTAVLAGAALAGKLGLKSGDAVTLVTKGREASRQTFMVSGILFTGGPEEHAFLAPLAAVQSLSGLQGKVESVSVSALTVPDDQLSQKARSRFDDLDSLEYDRWYCTAYVSSITHQIEEVLPNASARPVWRVAAGEGAMLKKIQVLMLMVTLAAFAVSGLGISSLMTTTVMERSREIGLMKSLGASNGDIYRLFLSEAALIGVMGGLLGFAAGAGLSRMIGISLFGAPVAPEPLVIPVSVVVATLITLTGSFLPSRQIAGLHPAEVLHGR